MWLFFNLLFIIEKYIQHKICHGTILTIFECSDIKYIHSVVQPLPVFPKFLTTPNRNCVFSEFSDGPVFRTPCFQLLWVDLGLIPGRGTNKIPQAALHGQKICFKKKLWDFPGGPVVKTPRFHCRGHRFDPWSPSQGSSTCCAVLSKRKETLYSDLMKR